MINRLEGYSGDGFNERRAYIGNQISKNFDKKREEKLKVKQENQKKQFDNMNKQQNTLRTMNNMMRNNSFK